jgi:hypothetical protein
MTDTTTTDTAAPAATDQPAPASGGLLDAASPVDDKAAKPEDQQDGTGSHLAEDPTAKAAAAEQAKRERPDWLPEKFWDKDKREPKLDAMAKSYAELEKNFKSGKHKAPDGGKYVQDVFGDKVPQDDPLVSKFTEWAGKYSLPQAAYDELAQTVIELAGGAQQEVQINREQEMKALGPQADAVIGSMVDWARGFVRSGVWSADDFEEFKVMGGTANGMRALMKLRESYEGRVPLKETVPSGDALSREELDSMVADPRYLSDPSFHAKVTAGFEKLYGTSPA